MSSTSLPTAHLPSIMTIKENKAAIFYDFDGVMTDNRVLVNEEGLESVYCNRSDGLAISEFRKLGIHQAIISTESNPVVARRAEKLNIPVIYKIDSSGGDKGKVLQSYAQSNDINLKHSIFIGNDLNDLPALKFVGYPCCPSDAYESTLTFVSDSIEKHARGWISMVHGGYGVVRELYSLLVSVPF